MIIEVCLVGFWRKKADQWIINPERVSRRSEIRFPNNGPFNICSILIPIEDDIEFRNTLIAVLRSKFT